MSVQESMEKVNAPSMTELNLERDDMGFLQVLTNLGMPEADAVKFLQHFLTKKTGEPWCFVAWDPTAECPEVIREFVRERDLQPENTNENPEVPGVWEP